MLAKKYRLPIQNLTKKEGRVIRTPYFSVKIFPNKKNSYPRFGVIISKKVFTKASARNSLKRLIFSKVNLSKPRNNDFLIIVSPAVGKLEQEEVGKKLEEVFSKLSNNQ